MEILGVFYILTNLQIESYKLYGITPSRTLQIAQSLYLAGLISYPRTSSEKLPASIGYKEILKKLSEIFNAGIILIISCTFSTKEFRNIESFLLSFSTMCRMGADNLFHKSFLAKNALSPSILTK